MKLLLPILLIFSYSLCGCKKYKPETSVENLLVNKNWHIKNVQLQSWISILENCDKDNTISLHIDKTAIIDKGTVKCDTTEIRSNIGTWELMDNNKKISILGVSYDIEYITTDNMALWLRNYTAPGIDSVDIYFYFKAQ